MWALLDWYAVCGSNVTLEACTLYLVYIINLIILCFVGSIFFYGDIPLVFQEVTFHKFDFVSCQLSDECSSWKNYCYNPGVGSLSFRRWYMPKLVHIIMHDIISISPG
jgi:hypothetical protein